MSQNKVVPHEEAFKRVARLSLWNNRILIFTAIIALTAMVFDGFLKDKNLNKIVDVINSVAILTYFVLDIVGSYLLQKAETTRRLVFIDNSFDVNLVGEKSMGYFTNESLTPGVYRMAVNCFENVFFSHKISSRMLVGLAIKNILIGSIFIVAASMGESKLVNLIFQLSLPVVLAQQFVKLMLYVNTTENVLTHFKTLFNDLKGKPPSEQRTPEILRNVIQYETNISWGSIMLSSVQFEKFNDQLSQDWDRMKKSYGI